MLGQEADLEGRIVFIENYNMRVARMLVQGVDVWLNTPRRPLEASGTSGQKAAVNGVLNCSILDGWWPEGYDGENGWAIGSEETAAEEWIQDQQDVNSLYSTLEEQIAPRFYERNEQGMPVQWVAMMKRSMVTIGARFSASRMVREYTDRAYMPLAVKAAARQAE
jgi:starch phosphorylase